MEVPCAVSLYCCVSISLKPIPQPIPLGSYGHKEPPLTMTPIKTLIRPLVALVFILCVVVDLIVLPLLTLFLKLPHSTNLTEGFWFAFGAYLSVYAWGRTREKVNGVEPDRRIYRYRED